MIENENEVVAQLRSQLKKTAEDTKLKEELLNDLHMASNNFFTLLQKYKVDMVRV